MSPLWGRRLRETTGGREGQEGREAQEAREAQEVLPEERYLQGVLLFEKLINQRRS
jgi:hypothetical protein